MAFCFWLTLLSSAVDRVVVTVVCECFHKINLLPWVSGVVVWGVWMLLLDLDFFWGALRPCSAYRRNRAYHRRCVVAAVGDLHRSRPGKPRRKRGLRLGGGREARRTTRHCASCSSGPIGRCLPSFAGDFHIIDTSLMAGAGAAGDDVDLLHRFFSALQDRAGFMFPELGPWRGWHRG